MREELIKSVLTAMMKARSLKELSALAGNDEATKFYAQIEKDLSTLMGRAAEGWGNEGRQSHD